jgi:tRNA threonylcarbamoyladenosine biosynthesis protein TsaB
MAVARNLPLIGVSAFGVIAAAQPRQQIPVVTVVEAGRGRVAACRYEWHDAELRAASPWIIQKWQDFANAVSAPSWVCGDLTPALAALLDVRNVIAPAPANLRRAGVLAELAYTRWQNGDTDDPLTLMPIYPPEG